MPTCVGMALLIVAGCDATNGDTSQGEADTASWRVVRDEGWTVKQGLSGGSFQFLRAYAAVARVDGSVVVGNSGTMQLVFLGNTGEVLYTVGREGAGPGEYRSINWITRIHGDSLLIYDLRQRRFTVLDAQGRYSRSFPVAGTAVMPFGVTDDSHILLGVGGNYDPRVQQGGVRDTLTLFLVTLDGAEWDSVARVPGREMLLMAGGSSYQAMQMPLGSTGFVAVSGERIVYASSESDTVVTLDAFGRRESYFVLSTRRRALTRRETKQRLEEEIPDPSEKWAVERYMSAEGMIALAPRLSDLRIAVNGDIWVKLFPANGSAVAKWIVVSPTGDARGSVLIPTNARPMVIGRDHLYLKEIDENGVETITHYEVVK